MSTAFTAILCTCFWRSDVSAQNLAWAPQLKVPGVGTSVGPSLAVFQGRLYAAWKGISGDQGIWWSSFDGGGWAPQQQVPGVGTSVGPSLVVFQGRLYAAWKGVSDDQGIYWSSFDGVSWAPQQNIPGVGTSGRPSLAVVGPSFLAPSRLYAAWKGVSDDPGIYWSSFDCGGGWAPQQQVPGVGTSVGPSLAEFNHELYAAWKGVSDDQGIYWSRFDRGGWFPQKQVPGVGTSFGPSLAVFGPSFLVAPPRLYAAWKGVSDDQGIWWSSLGGRLAAPLDTLSWAPQQNVPRVGTSVGPSLAVFQDRLYASWKGISGDQGIWWSSAAAVPPW